MDYRIDEKGKVYTQQVTKQEIAIVARVENCVIRGSVHLTPGNRLKDELNGPEDFVAITDARAVAAETEQPLFETEVLIVNKRRISWIYPSQQVD